MPDRETVRRYRLEAERCRELARQTGYPEITDKLLKIADTYDDLARQIESMLPSGN